MRATITLAVLAAATVAMAACGGSDEGSSDEAASFEDAQVEFAQCMRDNDVDFPDPKPGQDGFVVGGDDGVDPSSDEFQSAQEQCASILEDSVPEGDLPDPAEIEDELLELTRCLRDKGFDVPDPQVGAIGDGPPEAPQGGDDIAELMDDPDFQQAQEDCIEETGVELPGPGGGPGGG